MKKQNKNNAKRLVVIGGGAAGFFGAITCAENNEFAQVTILERGKEVLQKVKISGGGRCNLAHDCYDARELVKNYPRGNKALLGPFKRFSTAQTLEWFENHGVETHVEEDGRIFPVTNESETVVNALLDTARFLNVDIRTSVRVDKIVPPVEEGGIFEVHTGNGHIYEAECVLVAAGSAPSVWQMLEHIGHTIVKPVPSLFTFNIRDPRLSGLSGISVPQASVKVIGEKALQAEGPLLITHWGLSAPSILRVSAWGARRLNELDYKFKIEINWASYYTTKEVVDIFQSMKVDYPKRHIEKYPQFEIPTRLWQRLVSAAGIPDTQTWANCTKQEMQNLAEQITACQMNVQGKSTFKDEFVTAGGVDLDEVDFTRFESKIHKNLFLAGEILDIDAITGGFNFQAAWTGGYHVGLAASE